MDRHLLLILLLLISLNVKGQSFEGSIKFSTHISALPSFEEELKAKYGDSLIMYYSSMGDFKRIHKNSAETGADSQLYLAKKGMIFFKSKDHERDSVSVMANSLKLIKESKTKNETIMGLQCDCQQYEATSIYQQHVTLTYCYSKNTPKIDPNLFFSHIDFFLIDFYKMSKRPYLKFSIQTEEFTITYLASELKSESLDRNLFKQ